MAGVDELLEKLAYLPPNAQFWTMHETALAKMRSVSSLDWAAVLLGARAAQAEQPNKRALYQMAKKLVDDLRESEMEELYKLLTELHP